MIFYIYIIHIYKISYVHTNTCISMYIWYFIYMYYIYKPLATSSLDCMLTQSYIPQTCDRLCETHHTYQCVCERHMTHTMRRVRHITQSHVCVTQSLIRVSYTSCETHHTVGWETVWHIRMRDCVTHTWHITQSIIRPSVPHHNVWCVTHHTAHRVIWDTWPIPSVVWDTWRISNVPQSHLTQSIIDTSHITQCDVRHITQSIIHSTHHTNMRHITQIWDTPHNLSLVIR